MLAVDALESYVLVAGTEELAFVGGGWKYQHSKAGYDESEQPFEEEDVSPLMDFTALNAP